VRTIESHVSHALLKTGCRNRLELAMWLLGHQVGEVIEPAGKVPGLPA
jgi:DNA-binding NarL/FixJ family response regulator